MTDQTPPKIEFPCPNYLIKVMGESGAALMSLVNEVIEQEAPGFERVKTTVKDSRNGRFQSITVYITATGEPQLKRIHQALIASPLVKMVL